jgi:hypothetical protein
VVNPFVITARQSRSLGAGLAVVKLAKQIQTAELAGLQEQPQHRLETSEQKLPPRASFAIPLANFVED